MKSIKYIIAFFGCFMLFASSAFSQEGEVEMRRTRSSFEFFKEASGAKHLRVKIFTKDGPNLYPIYNNPINFYLQLDSTEKLLATVNTDEEGIANLYIKSDFKLDTIEGGFYSFMFEFEGNDTCEAESDFLDVKNLEISYEYVEDTANGNQIIVSITDDFGNPIPDENLIVYVDRMHSKFPIADDFTDEDGQITADFPMDLPGDSVGNLSITYKVAESFDYGTVYAKDTVKWGIPVDYSEETKFRALWSDYTPMWMLIAIAIVLLGAWTHFFIAIYHIIKMKRSV
jgi:5-hydroxyisourate hydrolase-like protein (transthyretin family)